MASAPKDGCIVEFGVYRGEGLIVLGKLSRRYLRQVPPLYGFDSFEGMPETQVPLLGNLSKDWAAGTFSDTSIEHVQRVLKANGVEATLIKGVFAKLPSLEKYGIRKIRFAYLDADIYEGYRDALRLLTPHVGPGTVLVFDESLPPSDHRYQGIRFHGKQALEEWERETEFNLHLINFYSTSALYVIVDEEYLRRYTRIIIRLKRDTLEEVLKGYVKGFIGRE
jgi:hypothetical protein